MVYRDRSRSSLAALRVVRNVMIQDAKDTQTHQLCIDCSNDVATLELEMEAALSRRDPVAAHIAEELASIRADLEALGAALETIESLSVF